MGLNFSDALHLSWRNLFQHKKRSITVIIVVSVLFSSVLSYSLLTSGIKKTAINASMSQTKNKIYIKVHKHENEPKEEKTIYTKEEIVDIDLRPHKNHDFIKDIENRARLFNGKIIGYYRYYQIDFPYQIVDKSVAESFIDPNSWDKIPEDKIPVVTLDGWKLPSSKDYDGLRNRLKNTIYKVGSLSKINEEDVLSNNTTILTPILRSLPTPSVNGSIWFIDDGTGKIENFIRQQITTYLTEDKNKNFYTVAKIESDPIISFENPKEATDFINPDQKILGLNSYREQKYSHENLFGTTIDLIANFRSIQFLYTLLILFLLVIAIIITITTMSHIIDEDAPTIALYRAMRATTKSIYFIYFLYLLELCLMTLIAIFFITFVTIIITYLMSASTLSNNLMKFYNLSQAPKIFYVTENNIISLVLITILLIAPISLLFSAHQFSTKNIAKKLKED